MERVPDRSGDTLKEVLLRRVNPGSIIFSDCWRGYNFVPDHFTHQTVNHSENFVSFDCTNTQRIEATWGILKRLLRKKGTQKCQDTDLYISEFIFRQKNKDSLFPSFLDLIKKHFPPCSSQTETNTEVEEEEEDDDDDDGN